MVSDFEILFNTDFASFEDCFGPDVAEAFYALQESSLSAGDFKFYTSVSAVYSSKIEGEEIEPDAFIKHKRFGGNFLPDHTQKVDDLYAAYLFAEKADLTEENVHKAHGMITTNILKGSQRGTYRKGNMYVLTEKGDIEYVAAPPDAVENELRKFFNDISRLLIRDLSFGETFLYAAMIHLVFVKIHPYEDGNGRTGRLLEKWFLAKKLGPKAWFLQSEKYYYLHHGTYYHNLRQLGLEYEALDFSRANSFLKMLPQSLSASPAEG